MCTSITHLCADPTIDKNYDPATNEFVATNDGGTGGAGGGTSGGTGGMGGAVTGTGGATGNSGGSGGSDAGVDAAVTSPGDDSGAGGDSGGGDASVDAPVTNPGDDAGTGSGGSGGSLGGVGGSSKRDAGIAGASGTACTPGQTPTKFEFPATSASDPNYTSGVGVLTATELLTFNAYAGPDSADGGVADSGTVTLVNRIDVQHFDPITGKKNGSATPLLTAAGDGSGIFINGAAVAPTGEIAIIYSAATGGASWPYYGVYLAFLDKDLAPRQTTLSLFVVAGSNVLPRQSYVQWINGEFVASSVFYNGSYAIKVGRFGADGSNLGITRALPTDDPSGFVWAADVAQGEVAFSGNTLAAAYSTTAPGPGPSLTFVDASDATTEVGSPLTHLPGSVNASVAVAGTSQGFVAVYNGSSTAGTASLLATYVSNSASGDAGVPVGATYAFLGGYALQTDRSTRGSSAGTGAGFAALYPDGSVSFLYFSADGSIHGNPQTVLQQANPAGDGDEANITSFGDKFAVSLYSSTEHLTRVITSTCQ
jgi:hypothetical protein